MNLMSVNVQFKKKLQPNHCHLFKHLLWIQHRKSDGRVDVLMNKRQNCMSMKLDIRINPGKPLASFYPT